MRRGTAEDKEAWWLAHFIAACEADTTYGCDVDKIHAFDLHNYNCQATKWEDPNNFIEEMQADLKSMLAAHAPSRDAATWEAWVDNRNVWVTETSYALHSNKPHTYTIYHVCSLWQVQSRAWRRLREQRGFVSAQLQAARRCVGRRQHSGLGQSGWHRPMGLVDDHALWNRGESGTRLGLSPVQ